MLSAKRHNLYKINFIICSLCINNLPPAKPYFLLGAGRGGKTNSCLCEVFERACKSHTSQTLREQAFNTSFNIQNTVQYKDRTRKLELQVKKKKLKFHFFLIESTEYKSTRYEIRGGCRSLGENTLPRRMQP